MIAIYFVAWVLKKIKGEEEEEVEKPSRTQEEVQENRRRHLDRQAERESRADVTSEALRQMFESISGESSETKEAFLPESEASPPKPPPLKKSSGPPSLTPPPLSPSDPVPETKLTLVEQAALEELNRGGNSPYRSQKSRRIKSLRAMTRGSRGLRQAVVFKEILDKPRALRPY